MKMLEISNKLRMEAEQIIGSGLPLDIFPQKVQEIIINLSLYENFNTEFSASIVLSSVAAAIGNSCQIQIKGNWKTSPSIYMMLIGRPGLGKTPPLSFLYQPLHEEDDRLYEKYIDEFEEYERALATSKNKDVGDIIKKPQLVTHIISDFTPEAMLDLHRKNLRGITVEVDEILSLFNSVKRYNGKNNLIEDLLSAYSGRPLKSVRKSESKPIFIKQPCINVIGSVQTKLLSDIFRNEYKSNGLLDRFLFVYPKDQRLSKWEKSENLCNHPDTMGKWRGILNKIINLPCPLNEKGTSVQSLILRLSDEAESYFYDWYNGIIDSVNAIKDDADVESRKTKLDGNAARLALVFQIMKWAAGEDDMNCINIDSVKAAIQMINYYEDTYDRIQESILTTGIADNKEAWISLLKDTFTTGEAVLAGKKVDISRRSVYYALEKYSREPNPIFEKIHHGTYRKITSVAPCTIALLPHKEETESYDSAKVQSANENTVSHG